MNVTGKFGRMHLCRMVHSVHCIVKIHIIVREASYASAILIKKTAPVLNGWPLGGGGQKGVGGGGESTFNC